MAKRYAMLVGLVAIASVCHAETAAQATQRFLAASEAMSKAVDKTQDGALRTEYEKSQLTFQQAACDMAQRTKLATDPKWMEACAKLAAALDQLPKYDQMELRLKAHQLELSVNE